MPTVIPAPGFAEPCDAPLTVTEPETKVVPVGIGSVKITLVAATLPVFLRVVV